MPKKSKNKRRRRRPKVKQIILCKICTHVFQCLCVCGTQSRTASRKRAKKSHLDYILHMCIAANKCRQQATDDAQQQFRCSQWWGGGVDGVLRGWWRAFYSSLRWCKCVSQLCCFNLRVSTFCYIFFYLYLIFQLS